MKIGWKEKAERPNKVRSKRRKAGREKRVRKLEKTPKQAEYGERKVKENKKRHQ